MSPSPVVFSAAGSGGSASKGGGQKLEKACLLLHEPSTDGSLSQPGERIRTIEFQFNPKELSLSKSAKWDRDPGSKTKKGGPPQYK
ncbi:MAG: hypothetical protein WCG47_02665, partial [Dermatophilaceae bacterium]